MINITQTKNIPPTLTIDSTEELRQNKTMEHGLSNYGEDYIATYESALLSLESDPNNSKLQSKAVLALARMGSLNFALKEYRRYRLDKIRHHEDIMALGGRLSKDFFLASSGAKALEHARDSAAQYEAAFQDTKGFYSGINSATMAFLSDMPWDIVKARVDSTLNLLPPPQDLTPENHYFIEATRAECLLLLGDIEASQHALRKAVNFDPLNYTAHASTLKQFRLILDKRDADQRWLDPFKPPHAAHYAGHIWPHADNASQDLPTQISDMIQRHDIGFGYGALAAGSDILIAEALLAEGAELNLILPTNIDHFIAQSVQPFGDDWLPRFHNCLEQAHSLTCLSTLETESHQGYNILAARMAMGQAILRGKTLNTPATQLLIHDPKRTESLTSHHKTDWDDTGLSAIHIKLKIQPTSLPQSPVAQETIPLILAHSTPSAFDKFKDFDTLIKNMSFADDESYALHFDLNAATEDLEIIKHHNHAGHILASESVASFAALKYSDVFDITFAGIVKKTNGHTLRCYSLRPQR